MLENLPHSYEAECSVLGSILIKPSLYHECELTHEDFFYPQNALIMKFMHFLADTFEDKPIDIVLLAQVAGKDIDRIGGIAYLAELAESVPTTSNFKWYHDSVRETSQMRKAMEIMDKKAQKGPGAETSVEFIEDSIQALEALRVDSDQGKEIVRLGQVLRGHEELIQNRKDKKGLTGTKTASVDLDKFTGGWQKQDLIIVAARPSMGKTAWMMCDAIQGQEDALKENTSGSAALIFSIEMPELLLAERAVSIIGNLEGKKMKSGDMSGEDWHRWSMAVSRLNDLPIFIDDSSDITVQQIKRKAKKFKKLYPNAIFYIDYLQKVKPGKKLRQESEEVSFVSGSLKQIARELDCPVVALCAVGRDCEKRQNKRPQMSDIRNSGSIESDADIVSFLYRDDYYNKDSEKTGIVEIIIAKARNGPIGIVEMAFMKAIGKFLNLDRTHQEKGGAAGGKAGSSHEHPRTE